MLFGNDYECLARFKLKNGKTGKARFRFEARFFTEDGLLEEVKRVLRREIEFETDSKVTDIYDISIE